MNGPDQSHQPWQRVFPSPFVLLVITIPRYQLSAIVRVTQSNCLAASDLFLGLGIYNELLLPDARLLQQMIVLNVVTI